MLEKFKAYLIQKGFREFSTNNNPSTAIDYCWRLEKICLHENITVEKLATDISKYLQEYSISGNKSDIGRRSHFSYYYALRQFRKFVLIQRFSA